MLPELDYKNIHCASSDFIQFYLLLDKFFVFCRVAVGSHKSIQVNTWMPYAGRLDYVSHVISYFP